MNTNCYRIREDVFGIIRDLQTECHVGSQRRETFLLSDRRDGKALRA